MKSQTDLRGRKVSRRAGILAAAGLLGISGVYWQARSDTPGQTAPSPVAAAGSVRTVRAASGPIHRTLRVTGVISPERFSSLLAPQLRGSRGGPRGGGGGGGGGMMGGGGGGGGAVRSGGGGSGGGGSQGGGGSSRSSSGSGGGSGSGGQSGGTSAGSESGGAGGSSMAGGGGSMGSGSGTSGLRSALSRFSTPSTTRSSSSSSRSTSSGSSSSSSSLGSTSSELGRGGGLGGSGGGGGGGDFNLILQSAVPPGSRVKKGDVVAEFDRQYMITRLDDFKASLEQQEASLKSMEANLGVQKKAHRQSIANAKAELDKALLDLKTIPVRSDIESERLKLSVEEAQASYKQLQAEITHKDVSQDAERKIAYLDRDQSHIDLQRIEANAERMLGRAAIDGIVVMGTTFRGGEMGQIQPGDQVHPGVMYMRIVDPSSMVVNASVNQVDIESVRIGMRATIRFDAYPDLALPARVHSIAAMPKSGGFRAQYVKEIPIVLKLEKMDPRVIPDLSVAADIVLDSDPAAQAVIPLESVFREGGKPFAFVRGDAGWERRDIELGLVSNVAAVVRSGLRPGEVVAAEWPIENKRK